MNMTLCRSGKLFSRRTPYLIGFPYKSFCSTNFSFYLKKYSLFGWRTLLKNPRTYCSKSVVTKNYCNIHFIQQNGETKIVKAQPGQTLLEIAHANDINVEGACEASLACSTCHVILDENSYNRLPCACEKEDDLLDMAPFVCDTSRLSCQIIPSETSGDMFVRLPPSTLNFYVDGFVQKHH